MNADALAAVLGCSTREARRYLSDWHAMQHAEGVPRVVVAPLKGRGRRPYLADASDVARWLRGQAA